MKFLVQIGLLEFVCLIRALLSDVLDKHRPDFILLNECNKGKAAFNMSGYNLILSRNQEVGMIYRNIYFLNDIFNDIEDDYNIIRLVNSKINKFIIFITYTTKSRT